jgi:hypothetical protein
VVVTPPLVYVTVQVSPVVGWALPVPPRWAAKIRPLPADSVCPGASPNWYVTAAAVLLFDCVIWPPTVLYWPLNETPVVRWMTIVTDSAVIGAVFVMRTCCSP